MKKTILALFLALALLTGPAYASQDTIEVPNIAPTGGKEGGQLVREALNLAHITLATLFSGPSAPTTTYAYQLWADTGTGYLQQRNSANTAWKPVRLLDTSVPTATYASNTYSVTYAPAVTAYKDGMIYTFTTYLAANTGSVQFKINTLAAKYIITPNGGFLKGGEIAYGTHLLLYNNPYFILLNSSLSSGGKGFTIDSKSSGTNGGTFTAGSWQTRILNIYNGLSPQVTVASNQITMSAGSYSIRISCPAYQVDDHQAIFYNVTDNTVAADPWGTPLVGTSEYSPASGGSVTRSVISGQITITGLKVFEVRHRCTTTKATTGFGVAANLGQSEVYTQVEIWQE